jgi:hypothetical protein
VAFGRFEANYVHVDVLAVAVHVFLGTFLFGVRGALVLEGEGTGFRDIHEG